MALITCKNLSIGHHGQAVGRDLNFFVEEGDYFCIVGANGSGKSTLMKTLLGLQPALGGEITFAADLKPTQIGYLPQQTPVQKDFPASVEEIVRSGFLARQGLRPFYSAAEKAQARQAMARMEILDLSGRCYRELSGGQQQRVLLARALCAAKKVLLLDEPTAGLDPKVSKKLYDFIRELNEKDGMTILMISHDLQAALAHANRILQLGEDAFFGTKEDYVSRKGGQKNAG